MKISVLLLFVCSFQIMALNTYAQDKKLSITMKDAKLGDILKAIENQSDFSFFYSSHTLDLDKKVSIEVENENIWSTLDQVLPLEGITYHLVGQQIALFPKNNPLKQITEVTGMVTDEDNNPLPGVNILIKGTGKGVISNTNGEYSIAINEPNTVLLFSFIGYVMKEVPVGNQSTINVILVQDKISLDEVVAIGYGTARRKDLTGSIASVTGSTINDIPVTSVAQAISGQMAGVQVTVTEGSPDAEIKIRVRGGGSITQDNSPLYIVDGFPVEGIGDLAPTDIKSIDILKDASSTAIYGARGANGVILITTRGGFNGKGKVSYNAYFGVKNITKTLDVLSPYEYAYWQYELQNDNPLLETFFGNFQDYDLYKQIDPIDWQDHVFGNTGSSMYHNLSFSGGTENIKYNLSITRNNEEEIMLGSEYERTTLTSNTSFKINERLTIDLNTRLSDNTIYGAGTSSADRLSHAVQFRPLGGFADFVDSDLVEDDYEISSSYVLDPVKQTLDDYRKTKDINFVINAGANIKILENLKYRLELGTKYGNNNRDRFWGLNTRESLLYGETPLAEIKKTNVNSLRLANILTYSKEDFLPDQNITVMVGEELNHYKSDINIESVKYFPKYITSTSALAMMNLGITDPIVTFDNPSIRTSSFFGRLNYDYKSKYLFSATFRADGSSKFAAGNQWGYFPSAAIAWRISDEDFFTPAKKVFDDLKIRLSYGQSGNNRIADNAWKKTYSVSTHNIYLSGDETSPTAFLEPNDILSNPELKWETTVTRNAGLDFSAFKRRLTGSLEVYHNTTKDLLISATIPSATGYSQQWQNIGQTSNRGVEGSFNLYIVDKRDFKLSTAFNIAFNKNKIDKLGDTKRWEESSGWCSSDGPTGDYLIEEGGEIGQMYGYVTEGFYTFDDFDYNDYMGTYNLKEGVSDNSDLIGAKRFGPGSLKLMNQDSILDVTADGDKVVIGNANPKHTGGFNIVAEYKGFDMSAYFNWVYGNDIYNANKLYFNSYAGSRYYKNILDMSNSENRWTYIDKQTGLEVTDPTQLAEMNKNATIWSPANSRAPLHSWAIEDGSFLRLSNLTIGYSFPHSLKKIGIDKFRLYGSAYNLWTWTNYTGYDPEVDTQRDTPLTPGIDWNAYPRSRSFIIGINVEF